MQTEIEQFIERIQELKLTIEKIEEAVLQETAAIKNHYSLASAAMPENKSYFLNGIQTGSVVKAYHLTREGVNTSDEEKPVPISEFIDSVMRFASYPKRRVEILLELAVHLQNIHNLIKGNASAEQAQ